MLNLADHQTLRFVFGFNSPSYNDQNLEGIMANAECYLTSGVSLNIRRKKMNH